MALVLRVPGARMIDPLEGRRLCGHDGPVAAQPSFAELGLPEPELAVRLNGAAIVIGGVGLITGVQQRAVALGLVGSLVLMTYAGHPFWKRSDPKLRESDRIQALKNLGLIGGLLGIAARR